MSENFIKNVDNYINTVIGIVKEGLVKTGGAFGAVFGGDGGGGGSNLSDGGGSVGDFFSNLFGGGKSAPEPEQTVKLGRSAEFHSMAVVNSPPVGQYDVTMNDVTMPIVGNAAVRGNDGISFT